MHYQKDFYFMVFVSIDLLLESHKGPLYHICKAFINLFFNFAEP